jgi:hypothetical protein
MLFYRVPASLLQTGSLTPSSRRLHQIFHVPALAADVLIKVLRRAFRELTASCPPELVVLVDPDQHSRLKCGHKPEVFIPMSLSG